MFGMAVGALLVGGLVGCADDKNADGTPAAGARLDAAEFEAAMKSDGVVLLDVRTPAEYKGKIRPFQEKRAGHLPGALNIEMQEFVTSDYEILDVPAITEKLAKAGVTPDNEIVIYDTAGVRAAFVTMVLRHAGFHKTQCYDEGFQAWAGKADLPLEKNE